MFFPGALKFIKVAKQPSLRKFHILTPDKLVAEVQKFDTSVNVNAAITPPSSWFQDPVFQKLDQEAIFGRTWLISGRSDHLTKPGDYSADFIYGQPIIVVRDDNNELRGFYNVCRHHAAQLTATTCETGCTDKFVCPYHGWTYSTNGRLMKAKRLRGIENFKSKDFGLNEFKVKQWGPQVLVNFNNNSGSVSSPAYDHLLKCVEAEIGPAHVGVPNGMTYVLSTSFDMKCNWKVFVDNYLDGGYHVDVLHKDLTKGLDLNSYDIECGEEFCIQRVRGQGEDNRIGMQAFYGFAFPNFMINRYGPWLDTNIVIPTGPTTSRVLYHYYLETNFLSKFEDEESKQKYIAESLKSSEKVQLEDSFICESVQAGLESRGYEVGRYAPKLEMGDHDFHLRLASLYKKTLNIA